MKVDNRSKYRLVFSIQTHPQLGALIYPYVIEYTSIGTLSLTYQKLFSGNASHYTQLTAKELDLISSLDDTMVENIVKRFSPVQKIRPKEYFKKHFNKEQHKDVIRPYIEQTIASFLKQLPEDYDALFLADEINPAAHHIKVNHTYTKVLFHFRRNESGTAYFVTLKHEDQKVDFMKQKGIMLCNQPAFLVVNGQLYRFYSFVDGAKIAVFLNRKFIHVKPESEKLYYEKFVKQLLETAPVTVQGFDLDFQKQDAKPALCIASKKGGYFLQFQVGYETRYFDYHPNKQYHVLLQWTEDQPKFTRFKVSKQWEANRMEALQALGLKKYKEGLLHPQSTKLSDVVQWVRSNREVLEAAGFAVRSEINLSLALSKPEIHYKISEKTDWFDVEITVIIDEHEIQFRSIVDLMKKGEDRMMLPNGEYLLFPEAWFSLGEALHNLRATRNRYSVKKYQLNILNKIESASIRSFVAKIVDIQPEKPSSKFNGTLRKYQLDGLSWLMFLYNNRFGGILADDMGLGKTIQTLAMIQKIKGQLKKSDEVPIPFILVAPTSLLYNWKEEAERFCPNIKVHIHSGIRRHKAWEQFPVCDLLITSYGLMRNDCDLLASRNYEVLIMDESQSIKNSRSKVTQRIGKFKANCKLALTGTPVENSVKDLWSQMNILNPGLLGSQRHFVDEFVRPIEKELDKVKSEELKKRIKPFILRRKKEEVAKELPAITEKVVYCEMTEAQADRYEEIKSAYRNALLHLVDEKGVNQSKLSILQGLSQLRQIANHPLLLNEKIESGKHQMVLEHIHTALNENHKVLVFSQFVSYLKIISKDLNKDGIEHFFLSGATPKEKRKQMVDSFQEGDKASIFLISLKAGGTGLNLTAADYVFIVDPWWNPAAEAQARDRSHRIGQVNNVFSYKFISRDTIEEKILKLQQRKKTYATDLIQTENNILSNLEIGDLQELLR